MELHGRQQPERHAAGQARPPARQSAADDGHTAAATAAASTDGSRRVVMLGPKHVNSTCISR
jgi:hypothetical protein